MTDRQMRHMVSHAIAATQPAAEKYYHVCWWEKAVRCHHVRHTKEQHEIFFSAPGSVFLGELSAVQWRLLTTRIVDFCRRRSLVLDLHSGRGSSGERARRRWVTEFDSALSTLCWLTCGPRSPPRLSKPTWAGSSACWKRRTSWRRAMCPKTW